MSGTVELRKYLETIGCESYLETLTENGFYTTKAALASATYEELLDCNVRPVHAKLILSSLRASGGPSVPAADDGPEVVANFLRSVGLEHTQDALKAAGYTSMARLGESSYEELVSAKLKPVHARLIVSNLDSQSTAAAATPQRSMSGVDDEVLSSRTALLGGGAQKPPPRSKGSVAKVELCLACLIGALLAGLIILTGPVTGAGFNPARDIAPRLVAALAGGVGWRAAFPSGWWIYSAGPVVGAVLGAALCLRCLGSDR